MNRKLAMILAVAGTISLSASLAWGRGGGGGGFRGGGGFGGGGGFRGGGDFGGGGFRGGDFGGGFRGGDAGGGFRGGDEFRGGYGSYGYRGGDAFRGGDFGNEFRGGDFNAGAGRFGEAGRPNEGQLRDFLNMPGAGAGAGRAAGAAGDRPRPGAAGAGVNRGAVGDRIANARGTGNLRPEQQRTIADQVRGDVGARYNNCFNRGWWNNHPNWGRWGWNHGWYRPNYWWGAATWGALGGFWGGAWGEPIDYNYGDNIYYSDDTVYMDNQPMISAADYYQQAQDIAAVGQNALAGQWSADGSDDQAPPPDAQDGAGTNPDWMPLGVFALATSEQDKNPTRVMQLAVNKSGVISGTMYNSETDQVLPIQGSVDKQTQRAAWTVGDKTNIVIETGVYNLTKDQTTCLVHFSADKTQTFLLIRLKAPAGGNGANPAGSAPPANNAPPPAPAADAPPAPGAD